MRGAALFLIVICFLAEVVQSSSSFVRAHIGKQAGLYTYLENGGRHTQTEVTKKRQLQTRRFSFAKDVAIATHGSSGAFETHFEFPEQEDFYGFHYVDRGPQDFYKAIFHPPKRA